MEAIEKKGIKCRIQKKPTSICKELRSQPAQPVSGYSFPFVQVPKAVTTTILAPYLTRNDLANFHGSFKAASEFQSASYIIQHHHLELLIDTYLHRSSITHTESGKAKASKN